MGGSPEDAAKGVIDRYLNEFMSTRLGIRRESEIVRAGEREGKDGRLYYDVAVRIRSFAASNQYGLTQQERPQTLEWDRTQLASFGVGTSGCTNCASGPLLQVRHGRGPAAGDLGQFRALHDGAGEDDDLGERRRPAVNIALYCSQQFYLLN